MIATCTNCPARYQLEDAKIPNKIIKVRCPACLGVFALDGTKANMSEDTVAPAPVFETPEVAENPTYADDSGFDSIDIDSGPDIQENHDVSESESESITEELVSEQAPPPEPEPVTQELVSDPIPAPAPIPVPVASASEVEVQSTLSASVATLDEPDPDVGSHRRRRRCKEEMLARALVSDILVYNRDTRDDGLAEGNLLEVLGGEIKKSWELYKEKVTPEVANSTTYFRDALNEILADGTNIF